VSLPAAGTYTFLACTFDPNQEADFNLSLYCTDSSFAVKPLNGGEVAIGGLLGPNRARPQGIAGPGGGAKKAIAPPAAKYNVSQTREELGDDGKMGYAQKMEFEEVLICTYIHIYVYLSIYLSVCLSIYICDEPPTHLLAWRRWLAGIRR